MRYSSVTIVVLLIAIDLCFSANSKAQGILDKRASIVAHEKSLATIFAELSGQTNVQFIYSFNPATEKPVSFMAKDERLRDILNKLLKDSKLEFEVVGERVVIKSALAASVRQQPRTVTGLVTDVVTREPLPGVSVKIQGSASGTTTDSKGYFSIQVPGAGTTLLFNHLGYGSSEVVLDAGQIHISVALSSASNLLREVTVLSSRRANTEVAVLEERRKAAVVQDAISAQQIERTASITTTQALQRVTGVTVTDDRYVAIRGLGDRSVIGQLNGIRLASSDPDRSAVPLDLVPAALLDNITVYKTVTPDKPADAAAGIIELKTKSVPDTLTLEFIAESGFNSNIGIGGQFNSFDNSGMGLFGTRINQKDLRPDFLDLAQQYPDGLGSIQRMIANSNHDPAALQEVGRINRIMQGFDPVMTSNYQTARPNQLYSVTYGNRFNLFEKHRLGLILGGSYYRRTTDISGGDLTQYSIYQGVTTGNPDVYSFRNIPNYVTPNRLFMGKYQTYQENTGVETLNYGVLAGLAYQFGPRHEISIQYLGSWGGENTASNMNGAYDYSGLPGDVSSTVFSLKQSYRTLNTYIVQGEHKFLDNKYSPRLSYNLASSTSSQNDPDYRFATLANYTPQGGGWYDRPGVSGGDAAGGKTYSEHLYALTSGYVNGFGVYGIIQAEPNGRRWRHLDETNYNYKADLSFPFPLFGQQQELKTGINYLFRERDFTENQLFIPGSNFTALGAVPLYDVQGNLDRLVSNEVVGVRVQQAGQGEGTIPVGGFLYNSQKSPNNYTGYYETNALYGMLDLKLTEKIRVAGGVRFEMTNIGSVVDTADIFLDPALTAPTADGTQIPLVFIEPNSAYKTGYKPYYSVNITYSPHAYMNFRAAYNTTLARPELREITNVFEFDAFQMGLVVGNPNLVNQHTQNLDFRWEWFPNPGEVLAFSAFGKQIRNQLVKVFSLKTDGLAATYPEFPTIQFQNDQNTGRVWGVEMEVVKDLGAVWFPLQNFFIGTNLMLAQSEIKKSAARYEASRSLDRHTPNNSPLFEQAPYSMNGWLNYNNKKWGTDLTTTFNMVGERLIQINLTGEPDLYTRPVPMLDFVFSQRITRHIQFKGYAKNILNPAIKTVYTNPGTGGKWYGKEYINRSYQRGCELMAGFTYNVF